MKDIVIADGHALGRRLNNREENLHLSFRRRRRAIQRFRRMKVLQKFSSVRSQIHNHFNQKRHFIGRNVFKQWRADALARWHALPA
jgi:putative transposase